MTSYTHFLQQKERLNPDAGRSVREVPSLLFDWQQAIVRWATRKGRAAIFADCGLGKTLMQLAWARALGERTLFVAPLCVAEQTVGEAIKLDMRLHYATDQRAADGHAFVITNYERLDNFDPTQFGAVVLDESSILKSFDGKTRSKLIAIFKQTPYRLCCTATPSPNDIAELANHAEFLGLMTRAEFLATWFVHDDSGWRMKRPAVEPFYRWLSSWAVSMRTPSDLGYPDDGFLLPPLRIGEHLVPSPQADGVLFPELGLHGISGRLAARRSSLQDRIAAVVRLVEATGDDQWLLWCGLNAEAEALAALLDDGVNVKGNDSYAEKVAAVQAFLAGDVRVLITKPKILGFGMNFQRCHRMAFVGLSDSYESYYQCIRRAWRFGQQHPVDVAIVVSDAERGIVENVRRKEAQAAALAGGLLQHVREFEREELVA